MKEKYRPLGRVGSPKDAEDLLARMDILRLGPNDREIQYLKNGCLCRGNFRAAIY